MYRVARIFAKTNHLEANPLLNRTKYFIQHRSDRKTRFSQAEGAFISNVTLNPERTYVLLDDVFTTGATIQAAVTALKNAGAKIIIIGVIARQPID